MSQKYMSVIRIWGDMYRGYQPYYNPNAAVLDYAEAQLRFALSDGNCTAIILHWRTGGGEQFGAQEFAKLVAAATSIKPVYSYTDTMLASAGYYGASGSTAIFCAPSAMVGSVGVFRELIDTMRNLKNQGIDYEVLRSGEHKARELPGQMTDAYKAHLNTMNKMMHDQFIGFVQARRTVATENLQGQIFLGTQAVVLGLVDGIVDCITDLINILTKQQEMANNDAPTIQPA